MKQPDWEKAPKRATHYAPAFGEWMASWCIVDGDRISAMRADGFDCMWDTREIDYEDRVELLPRLIPRPTPQWSGDGLPPVGTVCEVEWFDEWIQCEIIAHFKQIAADVAAFTILRPHGGRELSSRIAECFRPIRTQEQIAAEERESHVVAMLCHDALGGTRRGLAEALYDAGYRKGESK